MSRKLFCEISPFAYKLSVLKCRTVRNMKNLFRSRSFAKTKQEELLPFVINRHNSLIRRKLGKVDMTLQNNKAVNLSLSAPKLNKILIRPGETFSFWILVGNPTAKRGYKEGLTIKSGETSKDIGGGMCQFTNLIHWMVLHTDLDIVEHHHHDGVDLFPDFNRQIPFGTGTSIFYNYLDYQFKNNTDNTYQLVVYTTEEYLCGEIRASKPQKYSYHIVAENECFKRVSDGEVYRNGKVYRKKLDKETGDCVEKTLIRTNHARVVYDTTNLEIIE